ncbi:MAG: D-alanine--D-alanine ligase [Spongiibacteraceae bacterium]|nr:D-alanine--D-alanine ligase [Spongiibacteraceae bacterium]
MTKNVLLMWGGMGSEHEVSGRSAAFIERSLLALPDMNVLLIELVQEGQYRDSDGRACQLLKNTVNEIIFHKNAAPSWRVDFVIPCFHGFPGESGDIQSLLDLLNIPYLGCGAEASTLCFNKVTTKLWLNALGIPNVPYVMMGSLAEQEVDRAYNALEEWGCVFIKAASQGSSVGCYQVSDKSTLAQCLEEAFTYSSYVLVEQTVKARELEVAVYEYQGEIVATLPGEIHSPEDSFYTYDEKYNDSSHSITDVVAKAIMPEQLGAIKRYAIEAFIGLKLRHLSRIDFFLLDSGELFVNEINTFPGMTPISMFPKMMSHHGHRFPDFMASIIRGAVLPK